MALAKDRNVRFMDAPEMASSMMKVLPTSELGELGKRSRISELPQTRLVESEPELTRVRARKDSYDPTLLADAVTPAPDKKPGFSKRILKYIGIAVIIFFVLVILSALVNGGKNRRQIKPTPKYITDQLGNPVVANPLCRIFIGDDPNPVIGRLEKITEDGTVTYVPLGGNDSVTISGKTSIELLSEEELKNLKPPAK
jgi:hypothetical protein